VADDRIVAETLEESLRQVDVLLDGLPDALGGTPGPVVLGGFSQGGTTSLAYGLTRPERVALIANFSGFLPSVPSIPVESREGATPEVFWGHGLMDPAIPHALARRGRSRLADAAVDLTARDYPIGHWIAPEELEDFSGWVAERLDPARSPG
jgi:phospholipase/carboxylesterase